MGLEGLPLRQAARDAPIALPWEACLWGDAVPVEAMEMLRTRMVKTNSNAEFLMTMNLG